MPYELYTLDEDVCQWSGDGFCDDESNIEECDFDGGDCCEDVVG